LILFGVPISRSEAKGLDPNIYPQEDSYNRKLHLPVDHQNPEEGRFARYCHSLSPLLQSGSVRGTAEEPGTGTQPLFKIFLAHWPLRYRIGLNSSSFYERRIEQMKRLSLLFWCAVTFPQPVQPVEGLGSDDSTAAKIVRSYLQAVNSGDSATIQSYLAENYDPGFFKHMPPFVHLLIHRGFYYETAGLGYSFQGITGSSTARINALVQNKLTGAWLELSLPLAANAPHKINRFPEFKPASPPSGVGPAERMSNEEIIGKLEQCMSKLMENDDFSGAVLLAEAGKPIFSKAYGLSNREDQSPNRISTKFNIASAGKMFTGVAVAQLAEQGQLSLDDPLDKYLPADWLNPEVSSRIQIKHLLTHTSGLGDYFEKLRRQPEDKVFRKLEDYRPLVIDETPTSEPGTKWSYSNTGMLLAGVVIEQVTGRSYFDYVRDHIYTPAGMTNTDAYDKDGPEPNKATGYLKIYTDNGVQWMSATGERVMKGMPSGGSFSTVEDLLRFDIALREHKLLGPEYTEMVLSPKPEINSPFYGYGFNIYESQAGRVAEHGGDGTGIQSSFRMYLDEGYTVAVLANRNAPAAGIVDHVIHQLINR